MHQLTLTDDRHALPRLVTRLHALGVDVQHLVVRGRVVEVDLPDRAVPAVRRMVSVVEVRPAPVTRTVVTRSTVTAVRTTPHRWAA